MVNHKQYIYVKGNDEALDREYGRTKAFSKVRPGETMLFWRYGLRRFAIPFGDIRRIYRRVEAVIQKLCCGGKSYYIEWLVLVLHNGEEVVLHIGDDVQKDAVALLEYLQRTHPEIQYGKVYDKHVSGNGEKKAAAEAI